MTAPRDTRARVPHGFEPAPGNGSASRRGEASSPREPQLISTAPQSDAAAVTPAPLEPPPAVSYLVSLANLDERVRLSALNLSDGRRRARDVRLQRRTCRSAYLLDVKPALAALSTIRAGADAVWRCELERCRAIVRRRTTVRLRSRP